jgi:hypothetical protein
VPIFEQGRCWFPKYQSYTDYQGRSVDLVQSFIDDEYLAFPVCVHDDMLDNLARILEPTLGAKFPKPKPKEVAEDFSMFGSGNGWMG